MMKSVVLAGFLVMMTMASLGHSLWDHDKSPQAVERWYKQVSHAKPTLTKLHFYLNNIVTRYPPASTPIARAASTATSPTKFGLVTVLDAPLTLEPNPDSEVIGYAQGLFSMSSQEEMCTLMNVNFIFTAGEFAGSTITMEGRNVVFGEIREFPLVGGSGAFRLANGIGTATTYMVNTTSGDDILDVHFVFYRYVLPDASAEYATEMKF
ncbi:OLC1v1021697C1 [Oldenlandia corymbosa var. corymbosa]|uniref:Dirigent protein n=1 Tax=Oldenlandia corymbosa var. corymbosa TaxID=529605 RepID=A0AAV1BWF5_OLDCO|nr:OLC1v1021697C1 [Oldenlandia corymbosa var. corymbosa]